MTVDTQSTISLSQSTATTGTSSVTTNEDTDTSVISSDFETFLLMLTTQLENQDPLNPIESQDFAVQLATFSGVEQQVLTNDLLENLTGALGASDLAQLAGWVGMEARVNAPAYFDGTPIDIAISVDPGSDNAQLVVRDTYGREVSREEIPTIGDTFSWAGTDEAGDPLSTGTYTFEIVSINQGSQTSVQPALHYASVSEARVGEDETELVIGGGIVVPSSQVTALRDASAP